MLLTCELIGTNNYETTLERRDRFWIGYNPCVAVSGNSQGGTQVSDAPKIRPSGEHSAEPGKGQSKKARDESPSKEGTWEEEGGMKGFLRDNGPSLVLVSLFVLL